MDITLVTSSFDKIVHGTENEKKTGCGINLMKPENVTRFHRTSLMTDLKEITCEKCKASLAKKLIKADKKEMSLLLKEEKKREKMGMNDAGIVPLGNTTARITRDPNAKAKEEAARRKALEEAKQAAEEARRVAEEESQRAADANQFGQTSGAHGYQSTIPGTGVPMDDSLAQFAINPHENETHAPAEDDFLAQFAVNKPDSAENPYVSPAPQAKATVPQDDFLAQFAIPNPQGASEQTTPYYNQNYNQTQNNSQIQNEGGYVDMGGYDDAYQQPATPDMPHSDEDIMNLFSINPAPVQQPAYEQPVYSQPVYEQPVYEQPTYDGMVYGEPEYGEVVYDESVYGNLNIYDGSQPLYDANGNLIEGPIVTPADGYQPVPEQTLPQENNWDYLADQLFGTNEDPNVNGAFPDSVQIDSDEMADFTEESDNYVDPINNNLYLGNGVLSATYGMEQPGANVPHAEPIAAPAIDDLPSAESLAAAALDGAPKVDDIVAPETVSLPSAESLAAAALEGVPTVEDIAAPEFDTLPPVEGNSVPELDDIPVVPELSAPAFESYSKAREDEAVVLDDIYEATLNQPIKAEEEYDYYMSDFNNNGAPNGAEINGAEQRQAQQPQIVKVPQFAGYDANNQPVYKYVQMRLAGYDQNGKPVFVPLNAQQRPAAPAQQTAAQAQRAAAAPVQQAPVKSVVPKKPVQTSGTPTANISKIAVNPHSKSTSQAFINAIASSREYADKNLIETQGLKANSPVLTSVEDVLSTMGDDSAKRRQVQQAQQNVPVFDEYKTPARQGFRSNSASRPMQPQPMDARYMTKAELKNKKKQDKIDAKFRKEMSKRGF
ncbi:MAG: hypothetical protein J5723_01875 [Ruminococcus sp.]|nr:hypothetical protein [Ruminococcus sp.]